MSRKRKRDSIDIIESTAASSLPPAKLACESSSSDGKAKSSNPVVLESPIVYDGEDIQIIGKRLFCDRREFEDEYRLERKKDVFTREVARDPKLCQDQIDAIYGVYDSLLGSSGVSPTYMEDIQSDINPFFRHILIDWLVSIHTKWCYDRIVLWSTVKIMDRYLTKKDVHRSILQLVGITAFLIASKIGSDDPISIRSCTHVTDESYNQSQVVSMELEIVKVLNYDLSLPTGYNFIQRFLEVSQASPELRELTHYYAERALQKYSMLKYDEVVVAAACVYTARAQQAQFNSSSFPLRVWPLCLLEETGCKEMELLDLARLIICYVREDIVTGTNNRLNALQKKYSRKKFGDVALYDLPNI